MAKSDKAENMKKLGEVNSNVDKIETRKKPSEAKANEDKIEKRKMLNEAKANEDKAENRKKHSRDDKHKWGSEKNSETIRSHSSKKMKTDDTRLIKSKKVKSCHDEFPTPTGRPSMLETSSKHSTNSSTIRCLSSKKIKTNDTSLIKCKKVKSCYDKFPTPTGRPSMLDSPNRQSTSSGRQSSSSDRLSANSSTDEL